MVDGIGRQASRGPGHGSTQGRKEPTDLFWQAAEGRGLANTSAAPLSSPGVKPIPTANRALEHVLGSPASKWSQPHVVLVVPRRSFPFPSTSQKSSKERHGNPGCRSPSWAQSCSRHGVSPEEGRPLCNGWIWFLGRGLLLWICLEVATQSWAVRKPSSPRCVLLCPVMLSVSLQALREKVSVDLIAVVAQHPDVLNTCVDSSLFVMWLELLAASCGVFFFVSEGRK